MRKPIIAIDGPAGAGKSTIARLLSQQLNLIYLDTGAMYRAVTWLVLQSGLVLDDELGITNLANSCKIELTPATSEGFTTQVKVNGVDITREIRTSSVTENVPAIAAQAGVRQALVAQQQELGKAGGIVMEGRDIGTTVFPDAEIKIFLTASVQERAYRRQQDLLAQGQPIPDLSVLETAIAERDQADSTRKISPLRQAEDAIILNTDGLTIDMVVQRIIELYRGIDHD
ncbi:cytidylate kinase [Synechococcus sp. PCC 7502]|nr:(d)CMP kinase [Synechococcus sp. PCC 7502]AFY73215.1 cytidylate kinase [Synechococcus sp. PCC 7502]